MARTNIPVVAMGAFGAGANDIAWTNGDQANGHLFVNDGRTLLVVFNGDGSTKTITIASVADQFGRTGDIEKTLAAGKTGVYGPFRKPLFNQSTGVVNVDLSADTSVDVACVRLPADAFEGA